MIYNLLYYFYRFEVASNEELMRSVSGGRKINKSISSLRKREKGIDLRVLVVAGLGR